MTKNVKEEVKEEVKDSKVEESENKETEAACDNESSDSTESKKEKKNKYKEQALKLEEELKNLKNEYLKVYAEMENTKRRLKEDAIKDRKYASQNVVGELVTPVDMLLQIVNMEVNNPEVANYQIGFKMIANQLVDILKGEGLMPMEIGKEFDPKFMQAMSTEIHEDLEDNQIVSVMQPGYMFKDRILRPAMVVVNKKENIKEEKEEN